MKLSRSIALTVLVGLIVAATAIAQEKPIKRSELPAAVERTVVEQSQGATIRGFSQEKEKGQSLYEVEMTVNGKSRDILMDASGSILEVEAEVALDSLPTPVKQGLQKKAGKGKILNIESITKQKRLVAYEAQVESAGKRSEVQVSPDGGVLLHEE